MKIKKYNLSTNMEVLYEAIGEDHFIEVVKLYGGNNLYIPTYNSVLRAGRDSDIVRRYNGINGEMLAREYGISVTQIKNILLANSTSKGEM